MSSFAGIHRIKRPKDICILHRIVFTFVRNQIIVPCSKLVFLPGAACLLLDDLGLTGALAADGFGELDSATRPSSARPEQWTVHSALCLVPLQSRFWMLKAVPALESRACHFDLVQCSPALHCCCRGAPPQPFLCGQESEVEMSSSRKKLEPVLTLCNEVGWRVSCSALHVTRHR